MFNRIHMCIDMLYQIYLLHVIFDNTYVIVHSKYLIDLVELRDPNLSVEVSIGFL